MNRADILSVYMELAFGHRGRDMLKCLVNKAMDKGEWHDDFDIATNPGDLDESDTVRLLRSVKRAYPGITLNVEELSRLVETHLNINDSGLNWLVSADESIVVADSFRVVRTTDRELLWVTERVGWDGIQLIRINGGVVDAEYFDPIMSRSEIQWKPFSLSYYDGSVLPHPHRST